LKVGIGGERSKDHVVGEFSPEEEAIAELVIARAAEAVSLWLELGPEEIEQVLARVNRPDFCNVSKTSKEPASAVDGPPAFASVPVAGSQLISGNKDGKEGESIKEASCSGGPSD